MVLKFSQNENLTEQSIRKWYDRKHTAFYFSVILEI